MANQLTTCQFPDNFLISSINRSITFKYHGTRRKLLFLATPFRLLNDKQDRFPRRQPDLAVAFPASLTRVGSSTLVACVGNLVSSLHHFACASTDAFIIPQSHTTCRVATSMSYLNNHQPRSVLLAASHMGRVQLLIFVRMHQYVKISIPLAV